MARSRPIFMPKTAETTELFKYITKINVSFNPWFDNTASVREFWREVDIPRFKKANPKLVINTDLHDFKTEPAINVEFVDGSKDNFQPSMLNAGELLSELYLSAAIIEQQFVKDGKDIDNM